MTSILALIGIILMTLNLIGITSFDWLIVIALICAPVLVPAVIAAVLFVGAGFCFVQEPNNLVAGLALLIGGILLLRKK